MFKGITKKISGDPLQRRLEEYGVTAEQINLLEPEMQRLSDEQLKAKTSEFRSRLNNEESLDDLLLEAFALVREVSVRTTGLRHFDVQLIGGLVLHEGQIAEMKTGEGKTLVATLPIYLNALTGEGVHLVTVNDYLARRDARWMGPIFHFLGMSVGVLQEAARTEHGRKAFLYDPEKTASKEDIHQLLLVDRKDAYAADITYGTNNEFGFDYLRDNMAQTLEARSQRGHHYAILDEVDNILIDEARTPLIISGPAQEDPTLYQTMTRVVKQLKAEDFEVSERDRTVTLTELGEDHVEQLLGQPLRDPDRPEDITPDQARLLGYLEQSLRAEHLFKRNKDYVVQGGKVVIVDEFTGRMMAGRRWSDGLHQAVEAKEGVRIREENVTYATITLQNYFRMYDKLAGMTGTAVTEAEEFSKIYDVDVIPIPTNLEYVAQLPDTDLVEVEFRENGTKFLYYARPADETQEPVFWKRKDYPDVVFRTEEAKLRSVTLEILKRHVIGQPMLVGTTSVELSEKLSGRLKADLLQRLAIIQVLRDAYMKAHDIPDDGMRVEELQQLYGPLETLSPALLRPFSKELDIPLNPKQPENFERLASSLELNSEHDERLTAALTGGIPHNVLNAKKHTEESQIIASAGAFGAVTIATNMAGRGVDIKLGGEISEEILGIVNRVLRKAGHQDPEALNMEERLEALVSADDEAVGIYTAEIDEFRQFLQSEEKVREAGGLHVVGSERHEARRIDNQLRGRAARQGDPGSSQFFLSLEDELMRLFGGAQVGALMERFNIDDAVPIAHNIVNRSIEQSQTRVEGANFDRRKHLLEYDDVLNQQREIFYSQRNRMFVKDDLGADISDMLRAEVEQHVDLALEDPEGPWKLLAWLEETQPTLNLDSPDPYPSFMLALMLEQLRALDTKAELSAALIGMARDALDAQRDHVLLSIEEQLDRSVDRLKDQIRERTEMAEMAIEGAMIEADEMGAALDPNAVLPMIESSIGMRIEVDRATQEQISSDPRTFQRSLPKIIESSLGLRVWDGLLNAVERRVGQQLELDRQLSTPIDWDDASDRLRSAVQEAWMKREQQLIEGIGREVEQEIDRTDQIDDSLRLNMLVRMSYSQQTFFDKRTHQKRAVVVARFSYAHSAAALISEAKPEELVEHIITHLEGAQNSIQLALGESEVGRLSGSRLNELDGRAQAEIRDTLGSEAFEEHAQQATIANLPQSVKLQINQAMGAVALRQTHRKLLLAVGDRLWVDYLTQMEALRTSIGLEAYGQRDPLVQYKSRAVDMFRNLLDSIRSGIVSRLYGVGPGGAQIVAAQVAPAQREPQPKPEKSEGTKSRKRRRRRR
jgi:preprotein translocase subunit SecA